MDSKQISLSRFMPEHLELLDEWLSKPHVKQWYPFPDSNLEWAENPPDGGFQALIKAKNIPVGYIRWQIVSRDILDSVGLNDIPTNSADVDILIGEQSHIAQGIGPVALTKLDVRLKAQGNVPLIGLTTSKENHFAHKAFAKAGFNNIAEYSPEGFGDCFLFAKYLI